MKELGLILMKNEQHSKALKIFEFLLTQHIYKHTKTHVDVMIDYKNIGLC